MNNNQTRNNENNGPIARYVKRLRHFGLMPFHRLQAHAQTYPDSLRGSSVKLGTMQRRLAWPLRMDDTHIILLMKIRPCARMTAHNIGTIQRILAWPLRTDDTRTIARMTRASCYNILCHIGP